MNQKNPVLTLMHDNRCDENIELTYNLLNGIDFHRENKSMLTGSRSSMERPTGYSLSSNDAIECSSGFIDSMAFFDSSIDTDILFSRFKIKMKHKIHEKGFK